jgi:UDP-N-acetylglucosamine 3-dehydrogenase
VRYAIPKREPLLVEHERFRDAVLGKAADIVTLRKGLRTVEVSEAVLESAERGVTIETSSANGRERREGALNVR